MRRSRSLMSLPMKWAHDGCQRRQPLGGSTERPLMSWFDSRCGASVAHFMGFRSRVRHGNQTLARLATIAAPIPWAKKRAAFTLLEAVLALAILSAVAVVCVGVRTQSLSSARRMESRASAQRDVQAIFEMLTAGLLPPAAVDKESRARLWRGEYLGVEYELIAAPETLPNPVFDAERPEAKTMSDRIVMYRYRLTYRGRESEFWWHR